MCDPGTPRVNVLAFHGTADPIVPVSGWRLLLGRTLRAAPPTVNRPNRSTTHVTRVGCVRRLRDATDAVLRRRRRAARRVARLPDQRHRRAATASSAGDTPGPARPRSAPRASARPPRRSAPPSSSSTSSTPTPAAPDIEVASLHTAICTFVRRNLVRRGPTAWRRRRRGGCAARRRAPSSCRSRGSRSARGPRA